MDQTTYMAVLGLAFLSGATTLLGVALALFLVNHSIWIAFGIGFSAGLMLLISALELIPEAWHVAGPLPAMVAICSGAALLALLHRIIPHTHLIEENGLFDAALLKSAYLVVLGLTLHDVPEGFAMANAYIVSPSLGVFVAIGIALHNIPEEFAMALPVITLKRRRFLYGAAAVSALAEPVGAIVGLLAVQAAPLLTPLFMGAAAGAMIFVSLHELIPMARRYRRTVVFILGSGFSAIVYALLAMALP